MSYSGVKFQIFRVPYILSLYVLEKDNISFCRFYSNML